MDIYTLMKHRRSTRSFSTTPVSEDCVHRILTAGTYAPSGANQKPYAYIVITDTMIKEKLRAQCERIDKEHYRSAPGWFKKWMDARHISLTKSFLTDAPYLVVVVGEPDKPYWLESTWLSIAYILLAAEQEGLATLTYTPAQTDFLHELLDISTGLKPVVILPIGCPKNDTR